MKISLRILVLVEYSRVTHRPSESSKLRFYLFVSSFRNRELATCLDSTYEN